MSKRDRNDDEFYNQIDEDKHIKFLKEKSKILSEDKKNKKRNFTFNDFDIINDINEINDRNLWKRKSYNKDKQIEEFINFVYFKYEAPVWATNIIKNIYKIIDANKNNQYFMKQNIDVEKRTNQEINNILFNDGFFENVFTNDLLLNAMNGKGFKENLSHILTKKEIYYFLNSKYETIEESLVYAKIYDYNLNNSYLEFLINKFQTYRLFRDNDNSPLKSLLFFFAKHKLDNNSTQEIFDYVYSLIRMNKMYIDDKKIDYNDFFKRSLNNIIQLSNDYHIRLINLKANNFFEWNKRFDDFIIKEYVFKEIHTNRELEKEGKELKHCVGSYARRCLNGNSSIVSLRKDDCALITIEIERNKIVQAKGKYNRCVNHYESLLIQDFANRNNLKVLI